MSASGRAGPSESAANLAVVSRGFELFNADDLDTLFSEVFDPHVDYSGDPDISALAGFPVDVSGGDAVGAVWEAFFAMFDGVRLSEIELTAGEGDHVFGSAHMLTRGGSSEVPIDVAFDFAWVVRNGRWRFLAAKLDCDAMLAALMEWES